MKVIRGSMFLIKGLKSKRNLYELQVGCDSLSHKSENGVVFGSKRLTFGMIRMLDLSGRSLK